MITYVNTVLVGTGVGTMGTISQTGVITANKGQFVVMGKDGKQVTLENAADTESLKVGVKTKSGLIKWSNWINKADIKSFLCLEYTSDVPESVTVDFTTASISADKRYVLRITYKDLPTRYRKWTESYEVTGATNAQDLATAFKSKINGDVKHPAAMKRARVEAVASAGVITLTAMPYDDNADVNSISPAAEVRFDVTCYYTVPSNDYLVSNNKYAIEGAIITKTPGTTYPASAKLVRDMEAQAMGYEGILNRGDGTWPIIKPDMNTVLEMEDEDGSSIPAQYNAITLEFENMYRTADDLQRKTKQTLQIFDLNTKDLIESNIYKILDAFVKGEHQYTERGTSDAEGYAFVEVA